MQKQLIEDLTKAALTGILSNPSFTKAATSDASTANENFALLAIAVANETAKQLERFTKDTE